MILLGQLLILIYLESFEYRYFVIFTELLIKSIKIIILRILAIALLFGIINTKF